MESKSSNKSGTRIGKLRNWVISALQFTPDSRFISMVIGLALVIGGQIIMHRTLHMESWTDLRESVNYWMRFDAKFFGSVVIGMIATVIGGILLAITTFRSQVFQSDLSTIFPIPEGLILKKIHLKKWLIHVLLGSAFFIFLLMRVWLYDLEFFDVYFWIAAIFFFSVAVFRYDKASSVILRDKLDLREVGIIILLLIAGLLIATYQLQDIPNSIKGDEGNFFETARFVANREYTVSIFGFGVYSYPSISAFFQGWIMRLFGKDIWGWRFASVLPALLSVIPLYLLARDFFNRRVAILSSLIYISLPYYLSFARLGYNNSQAILFVIICVWLFFQGLKRKSLLYIFLSGAAAGLGFLTYTSGRLGLVTITILFGLLILFRLRKTGARRFLLVASVIFLIGIILVALPHLLYGMNNDPRALRYKLIESLFFNLDYTIALFGSDRVFAESAVTYLYDYQMVLNPDLYARLLLRGLTRTMLGFQLDEFSTNFYLSAALAGPIAVIFYVTGFWSLVLHFWKSNVYPVLIWFFSGIFFLSIISTYPPRPAHMVPIIPVLALFSGLGIYLIVEGVQEYLASKDWSWKPLRTLLYIVIVVVIMIAGTREYFIESPKVYRPNLEQVMNWAGLHNPPDTEIVYIFDTDYFLDWSPYFFRLGLTEPGFTRIPIEDLRAGIATWPTVENYAIFFEETSAPEILSKLKGKFEDAEFVTLLNRYDNPIGRAVVQGSMDLDTSVSLWEGVGNLLVSRVMWLVLPLFALYLYIQYRTNSLSSLPEIWTRTKDYLGVSILPALRKDLREKPEKVDHGQGRSFEFGVFLRLGPQGNKREYQAKIVLGSGKGRSSNHNPADPQAE